MSSDNFRCWHRRDAQARQAGQDGTVPAREAWLDHGQDWSGSYRSSGMLASRLPRRRAFTPCQNSAAAAAPAPATASPVAILRIGGTARQAAGHCWILLWCQLRGRRAPAHVQQQRAARRMADAAAPPDKPHLPAAAVAGVPGREIGFALRRHLHAAAAATSATTSTQPADPGHSQQGRAAAV